MTRHTICYKKLMTIGNHANGAKATIQMMKRMKIMPIIESSAFYVISSVARLTMTY
jgi:hypothetical protein